MNNTKVKKGNDIFENVRIRETDRQIDRERGGLI